MQTETAKQRKTLTRVVLRGRTFKYRQTRSEWRGYFVEHIRELIWIVGKTEAELLVSAATVAEWLERQAR